VAAGTLLSPLGDGLAGGVPEGLDDDGDGEGDRDGVGAGDDDGEAGPLGDGDGDGDGAGERAGLAGCWRLLPPPTALPTVVPLWWRCQITESSGLPVAVSISVTTAIATTNTPTAAPASMSQPFLVGQPRPVLAGSPGGPPPVTGLVRVVCPASERAGCPAAVPPVPAAPFPAAAILAVLAGMGLVASGSSADGPAAVVSLSPPAAAWPGPASRSPVSRATARGASAPLPPALAGIVAVAASGCASSRAVARTGSVGSRWRGWAAWVRMPDLAACSRSLVLAR
jgi:hypothetical protein